MPRAAYLVVALVGLLAHGILLGTDHVIWDGWWFNADLGQAKPEILDRQLSESGKPLEKIFLAPFRPFSSFDSRVGAAKVASVTAWLVSFVLMAFSLRGLARLSPSVVVAVTTLAAAAPFYEVLGDTSLWMHVACVLLFWLAWALVTAAVECRGARHLALRCASLTAFFLSFTLNSLLVYFYAVAACFVLLRTRARPTAATRAKFMKTAPNWADFIATPVIFWIVKTVCMPTKGYYANYNKPNLDPGHVLQGLASTTATFVAPTVAELFVPATWAAVAAIAGGLLGWWLTQRVSGLSGGQGAEPTPWASLAVSGIILFLGAAVPYVAVGQPIASYGWWSRNGILMPLPIAVACVAAAGGVNRWIPTRPKAWFVASAILTGLFTSASIRNYLTMQGYGAKQIAIRHRLLDVIETASPAIIQLRDYSFMRSANEGYPPSIWTYIASDLRKRPRTFVIDTRQAIPDTVDVDARGQRTIKVGVVAFNREMLESGIKATGMPYALDDIPRSGGQTLLVIQTGTHGVDGRPIGLEYMRRRWLEPGSLRTFVDQLVTAETLSLPPVAE